MGNEAPDKSLTSEEIDARREAGLKKLLATPHKPHNESKISTAGRHSAKDQDLTKSPIGDSVDKSKKGPRRSGAK